MRDFFHVFLLGLNKKQTSDVIFICSFKYYRNLDYYNIISTIQKLVN